MIRFYLKYQNLFLVLCVLIAFSATLVASLFFPKYNNIILIVMILCISFVWTLTIVKIAKFSQILTEKCDPLEYLAESDKILRGLNLDKLLKSTFNYKVSAGLLIDKATALILVGRYDEALWIFDYIQRTVGNLQPFSMAIIYNDLAYICAVRGDIVQAQSYAAAQKNVCCELETNKYLPKRFKKRYVFFELLTTYMLIAYKSGDLTSAEEIGEQIESAQGFSKLELMKKVELSFLIGTVKYELKKYDEASNRLLIAANNGNTMIFHQQAIDILNKLNQGNLS